MCTGNHDSLALNYKARKDVLCHLLDTMSHVICWSMPLQDFLDKCLVYPGHPVPLPNFEKEYVLYFAWIAFEKCYVCMNLYISDHPTLSWDYLVSRVQIASHILKISAVHIRPADTAPCHNFPTSVNPTALYQPQPSSPGGRHLFALIEFTIKFRNSGHLKSCDWTGLQCGHNKHPLCYWSTVAIDGRQVIAYLL